MASSSEVRHGALVLGGLRRSFAAVLIDYFRGARNRETDALDRVLAEGPAPATAPIIVQEFLQGFSDPADVAAGHDHLSALWHLDPPGYALHERAAHLHSLLKHRGRTVLTVDTLIVAMAREAGCALLTRDRLQMALARAARVPLA